MRTSVKYFLWTLALIALATIWFFSYQKLKPKEYKATMEVIGPVDNVHINISWLPSRNIYQYAKDDQAYSDIDSVFSDGFYNFCSHVNDGNDLYMVNIKPGQYLVNHGMKFISKGSNNFGSNLIMHSNDGKSNIAFQYDLCFEDIQDTSGFETIGWDDCSIEADSVNFSNVSLKNLYLNYCNFDDLVLEKDSLSTFRLEKSVVNYLRITNCYDRLNNVPHDLFDAFPYSRDYGIFFSTVRHLEFTNNQIDYFAIQDCHLDNLSFDSLSNNGSCLAFESDTIGGTLEIKKNKLANVYFGHCVIEDKISIADSPELNLIFEDCIFKEWAFIDKLNIRSLSFINCTHFDKLIQLVSDSNNVLQINFDNKTDVSKLSFFYDNNFKINLNRYNTDDENDKLYDKLITKFKSEFKTSSLNKIQIEHKAYQYSKHFWLYPLWFLDWAWWNYGFNKELIIAWTLFFLMLFFFYNYLNWREMLNSYKIFNEEHILNMNEGNDEKKLHKKFYYVFLFTLFIFFSLRIDFDRLQYDNRKFLSMFLAQYFIGLICLFFLVNAIFKI